MTEKAIRFLRGVWIPPASGAGVLALVAFCLLASGCASKNVNPAGARSHTGYVDFYLEAFQPLCWEIGKINAGAGEAKIIFEEYELRPERILRLAFKPGPYRLHVSFLNRVVTDPAVVDVVVKDGMISPVRVTLTETGKALVETRQVQVGGTFYGRYGRSTRLRSNETGTFLVGAEALEPLAYQPKTRMSYAAIPNQ